ncbi:UNVERIFIED_CONTAM: hypothetical protein Slati_2504800 [Sesamum latifolium]|uniref:SWIM-type domain-containing protein n=1 Tax=Sesamum latifolium TaxID=2727402 RepID=A0AAW2WEQ4_9LAMI
MEYIAHWNGHDQFELEGCYSDRHTLNLSEQTCSCRKWQLTGIPCAHAIAGIFFMGYKPEDYVDECYKKTVFLKTYSHLMMPLHGPEEWPQSDRKLLLPRVIERMPGHNSRTCPQNPKNQQQEQNVEVPPAERTKKSQRKANARLAKEKQNVDVLPAEKNRKGKRKADARDQQVNKSMRLTKHCGIARYPNFKSEISDWTIVS